MASVIATRKSATSRGQAIASSSSLSSSSLSSSLSSSPVGRAALVALALVALAGCGDDDIVVQASADAVVDAVADADELGGADVGAAVDLTAISSGAVSGPRVELVPTLLGDGTIEVRLLIRDVEDLFGLAAHLRYDAATLELVSSKGHPVLGGSGWEPRTLVHAKPGRLLLGGARVRVGGSPYAPLQGAKVGKQVWATLIFRKIGTADTALSFDPAHLLARAADYSVVPLQWQGLTIQGGGGR